MAAKELFEKIGLSLELSSSKNVRYTDYIEDKGAKNIHYLMIEFNLKNKEVSVCEIHRNEHCIPIINLELHIAIHQQMIELGWIEK